MLTFVGLGLYSAKDITVRGFEAVKSADIVYFEEYTSSLGGCDRLTLEEVFGRKIYPLSREEIENEPEKILLHATSYNVLLLTGGDPMIATTHVDLRLRAYDRGIRTNIIHAPSIFTVVPGITGLSSYKFGKTATISFPYRDKAESISDLPYDTIKQNRSHGLHTLLLLDITHERQMTIKDALEILETLETRHGEGLMKDLIFVGIARAGSEDMVVKAGGMKTLMEFDFGTPLHVLVAVGDLHFMEEEALCKFAGLERDL
ncbi:MAG: diphthine synthase [Candidatus Syntrophoarchaeum caldarius]|uniref:Diphthine synthase n=1 Tax=Candidatus Syntropharchaeum caldarium TaxID=1838285 RepID=A0A1F2PA03_9EURY|nr:MAG: diphthine synthase [Candidatus Syntrophoarchaeum caldarius]